MKRVVILVLLIVCVTDLNAQQKAAVKKPVVQKGAVQKKIAEKYKKDKRLSRLSIEADFLPGLTNQDLKWGTTNYFKNPVNQNISALSFNNPTSMGYDVELGYFMGKKRKFGIGVGYWVLNQTANIGLGSQSSPYHMEYQQTDGYGNPYRQVVTATGAIVEKDNITNVNIPIVLKYRTRLSKLLSFNMDLGVLYNIEMQNSTTTNAVFNYESVIAFNPTTGVAVTNYDASVSTTNAQVQNTELYFLHTHPEASASDAQAYFQQLASQTKENLGLNVSAANTKSTVNYTTGNFGAIIKPSLAFHVTDALQLNVGFYFLYQPFQNSFKSNYHLTDTAGTYNSVLKGTNSNTTESYGAVVGLRYYVTRPHAHHKEKDRDHDGVPDKLDRCPDDSGGVNLKGCPDKDKDGIADIDDSCPDKAGLAKMYGCPDRDGDGIPDKEDACPDQAGLKQFNGCPDSDGDGIADKDDQCPYQAGLIKFNGCPDTDGDGIPDNLDKCPNEFGPASNGGCPVRDTTPAMVVNIPSPKVDTAPPPPPAEPVVKKEDKHHIKVVEDTVKPKVKPVKKTEPKPEKHVEKIVASMRITNPVLFDINKFTIKESSKPIIREAIQKINDNPGAYVVVEGYTDTTGPVSYNKVLSLKRANVLRRYLIQNGLDSSKIRTYGMGSANPDADNKTRAGRLKNRRAELKWGEAQTK